MDTFFTQTHCDRCHGLLDGIRTMSMFNEDYLCLDCATKEKQRADYKEAVEADHAEIKKGNYNFKGIGIKKGGLNEDSVKTIPHRFRIKTKRNG